MRVCLLFGWVERPLLHNELPQYLRRDLFKNNAQEADPSIDCPVTKIRPSVLETQPADDLRFFGKTTSRDRARKS